MRHPRLAIYSWITLAYTLTVIIFGGIVRATGSGAGCGSHWPLCNGEVIPPDAAVATLIEYAHRITSGLAFLMVLVLYLIARRAFSRGEPIRRGAWWSLFFMILEALVGAGLVLFEYVAYNVSIARAYWMAIHLINTLLLVAAITLTAWHASGGGRFSMRGHGSISRWIWAMCGAIVLIGISGAVAALGDTLILAGNIDPASNSVVETLYRLRIIHPVLAILGGVVLLTGIQALKHYRATERVLQLASAASFVILLQWTIGAFNVWLSAPVVMQMVHLFVTDVLWIGLVLLVAEVLADRDVS